MAWLLPIVPRVPRLQRDRQSCSCWRCLCNVCIRTSRVEQCKQRSRVHKLCTHEKRASAMQNDRQNDCSSAHSNRPRVRVRGIRDDQLLERVQQNKTVYVCMIANSKYSRHTRIVHGRLLTFSCMHAVTQNFALVQ